MNEMILEFLQYDKSATDAAFSESVATVNPYALLESIDPELADMVYTHEVMYIFTEAEQITSLQQLGEKMEKLKAMNVPPAAFNKFMKWLRLANVAGTALIGGIAGANVGSEGGNPIGGFIGMGIGAISAGLLEYGYQRLGNWMLVKILGFFKDGGYSTPQAKLAAAKGLLSELEKTKSSIKSDEDRKYYESSKEKLELMINDLKSQSF